VLWLPAEVPGAPVELLSVGGPPPAPLHTLVLSVTAEEIAATWKDGPRVFTEDTYPRAILRIATAASPGTSPQLIDAIRTSLTMRGVPTDPSSELPDPVQRLMLSVADTEPYATLIGLLDGLQAFRSGGSRVLDSMEVRLGIR